MIILGIWDGHDSGAALLVDGNLIAAINEERLSRRKLEIEFPRRSIAACLEIGGVTAADVDRVAASTSDVAKTLTRARPSLKESYYRVRRRKQAPGPFAALTKRAKYRITEWPPNRLSRALSRRLLSRELATLGLGRATLDLHDHHACHAAGAALTSPFDSAVVVTLDGVGDGLSATVSRLEGGTIERLGATPARDSLGVFFEHVTHLLNMRELEDEGKVMALADYAAPIADDDNPLYAMLRVDDGPRFHACRPTHAMEPLLRNELWHYPNEQFAFMAQRVVERRAAELVDRACQATGIRDVALSGGVASNIKANRAIRRLEGVDRVSVFPHMGDGGLAVGAALLSAHDNGEPRPEPLADLGLGPQYDDRALEQAARLENLPFDKPQNLEDRVLEVIARDGVVLWFEGRMEYGPRALGHRSVLARADRPALRDRLNLVLKRRVWYQPFCPSMLASEARAVLDDFDGSAATNPHMTMAYQVRRDFREPLAGVINVDGSCRPQILADDHPGAFAALLRAARRKLSRAVLLNTSFNIHGEPLVCQPAEAVDVFLRSGADALVLGPFLCRNPTLAQDDS